MSTWPRVKLGACCEIVSGSTPRRDVPSYWNGDVPWATPGDISALDGRVLTRTQERITDEGYRSCSTSQMPVGSILFSSRAPIGLVAITGVPLCTNQGFKSLIPGPCISTGYLYWAMRELGHLLAARGSGSTFAEVSRDVVSRFEIPLPPLAEQRRIERLLDTVDDVQAQLNKSLSLAEQIPHSVFLEMFGNMMRHDDKQNLPRGWRVLSVSELAESSRYACAGGPFGSSLTRADYVSDPGVPVIRGANLVSETGRFHEDDFVFVSEKKAKELARNIAKPGDVVFTQRGTLGQVAEIPLSAKYPVYVVSQSQMKVSLNKGIADPQYIVHFFLSARGRSEIASRTMATGIPHINLAVLRGLPVVLPPLAAQRRFAAIVQGQYKVQQVLENALQETEGLLSSLAHNAFS